MSNYVRGQETFTYKLVSTLKNFLSLLLFSGLISLSTFLLLAYNYLPKTFWLIEKLYFKKNAEYIESHGILSFPHAVESFFYLSKNHLLAHNMLLLQLFSWSAAVGLVLALVLFFFFVFRGKSLKSPDYRRGSTLITPAVFNLEYRALIKRELGEIHKDNNLNSTIKFKDFWGTPFICSADEITIPSYVLHRHTSILGTTGVGKSTLIKWYLEYCRTNKEKVIIPDINGEYAAEFFQPGDIILSLFDPNTSYWDFQSESLDPTEFAKFLVPSGDEHNKFWWKGARQVVCQLLENFKDPSALWEAINNEESDISTNLTGLAKKIAGKEGTTQAAGITGSSILDFGFLRYLNQWPISKGNQTPFSIYNWTQDKSPNWVFITFSDTDKEIINPLFKLWLNTAITGLLKRTGQATPLNIIIDELATVGKIELLPTALERSRKYGGKIILGYQSESQLHNVYGKESAGSIKANTGTKFIFRCPEPNEARELSEFLGRQEIIEKSIGTSYGAKNTSDRENISEKDTIRNVVLDSEIRDLPDGHFYLKSLSIDPTKSRIKKKRWEEKYQPIFKKPKNDGSTDSLTNSKQGKKLIFDQQLASTAIEMFNL